VRGACWWPPLDAYYFLLGVRRRIRSRADGPADQADGRAGAEPTRGQRARRRSQQQRQVHGGQPLQTGRPQGRRNRPHGRLQRREVHQYLTNTHSITPLFPFVFVYKNLDGLR
jgi:hypothetical protein